MLTLDEFAGALARNVAIVRAQCEGLSHEESMLQLPFQGNCMNWVVGHILTNRNQLLVTFGARAVMSDDGERYRRGSETLVEEGDGVLALEELLARLDVSQERLAEALAGVDEGAMSREYGNADRTTTVGRRAFFLYFHETYHVGQTELLRQLAGKNDKVI